MRKLYIHGEINEEVFAKFSKKLDKLLKASPSQPIVLELSSEGGSAYAALAIYGRIVSCPAPIHVIGYGPIMSAATIILAAGHKRSMAQEAWFMIHDNSATTKGELSVHTKYVAQAKKEEDQWALILARHSKLGSGAWRNLSKKTTYLTSHQCLSCGIIDNILTSSRGQK